MSSEYDVFLFDSGYNVKGFFCRELKLRLGIKGYSCFYASRFACDEEESSWVRRSQIMEAAKVVVVLVSWKLLESLPRMKLLHQCRMQSKTVVPVWFDISEEERQLDMMMHIRRDWDDSEASNVEWCQDVEWLASIIGRNEVLVGEYKECFQRTVDDVEQHLKHPGIEKGKERPPLV